MLKVSTDVGVQVVVEEYEWPGGLCAMLERSKAISRQPECNIVCIVEVLVAKLHTVNSNMLVEECVVVFRVGDIVNDSGHVLGLFFGTVLHLRRHRLASVECFEARGDGKVDKELLGLARRVIVRLGTVWIGRQRGMGPSESAT